METNVARILGIAPYDGMRTAMEKIAQNYPQIQLDVYTGDMEEGVAIVQHAEPDAYDIIISRGGTAERIRQITDTPVIAIPLSVYDVLRAIRMAENYSSHYAIVGFPDITEPAHTLCDLLRYNLDIVTVHSAEEAASALEHLQAEGCRMVVCDMITHTIAQQTGLDAFLITSGAESLHSAFVEAISMARRFLQLRQENLILRQLAQDRDGNTVILDESGGLYYSVHIPPSEETLANLRTRIPDIPPRLQLKFYLNEGSSLFSVTGSRLQIGSQRYYMFHYVLSRIPLRSGRPGILAYTEAEVSQFILNSFFSISGAVGELEGKLDAIAASNQPLLIVGEPGTGKEQIARLIYLHSPRTKNPFVSIDCTLMDDKSWDYLLNHYSSPLNERSNTVYFQYAELLSPKHRAQLLTAITETDVSKRVRLIFSCDCGEGHPLPEAARLISGRLGCFPLHLPTLRSRADEIPSLAGFYLSSLNLELGKQIIGFDPKGIELLRGYDWPNNYAQFKQVLNELATLTDSSYIRGSTVSDLLSRERTMSRPLEDLTVPDGQEELTLEEITRDAVAQALAACEGNQSAAARRLGISRTTLWRYLNHNNEEK